jgi:hypothetical protein
MVTRQSVANGEEPLAKRTTPIIPDGVVARTKRAQT